MSTVPASPIDIASITGVILAGGRGTRMGSVEKGLQPFRGEPLVAHVARRLRPQVGQLTISANRHLDRYAAFAGHVIPDLSTEDRGPLAGLQAALADCRTEWLVSVPCDAPFVPTTLVSRLAAALAGDVATGAYARTAAGAHPVFCLMRRDVLPALTAYLDNGGRAVGGWIATLDGRAVSFDDEASFRNLNTVDDLHDAERADAPGETAPPRLPARAP